MKYIVRDSAIEIHHGNVGPYNNSVTWWRSIFQDGKEVSSDLMQRDFDTSEQADEFGNMLYEQFQVPAFEELKPDWYRDYEKAFEAKQA